MNKLFIAIVFSLFVSFAAIATENLPEGYQTWPVLLEKKCDELSITKHIGVTLDAEIMITVLTYEEETVFYHVTEDGDNGESSVSVGFYDNEWVPIKATEDNQARQDRLMRASLLQAGGGLALQMLNKCEAESLQEQMAPLSQVLESIFGEPTNSPESE